MFVSPAMAHVSAGSSTPGAGYGPLIFVAAAVLFVAFMVIDKKWREHRKNRDDEATYPPDALASEMATNPRPLTSSINR